MVALMIEHKSKFDDQYAGPFKIVQILSKGKYMIKTEQSLKEATRFLKPAKRFCNKQRESLQNSNEGLPGA